MNSSSSNLAAVGGPAAGAGSAVQHKKKRFHGNAAAAITARRAGHSLGAAAGSHDKAGAGGDDEEEGAFISSSRDASEEDNDEASGHSDSASSLRQIASAHSHITSPLPTTVHDRAVVDSRDAHRHRIVVPPTSTADKTPLSSSPSRSSNPLHDSETQLPPTSHALPTVGTLNDPHASAALSRATAALVDSKLADLESLPGAPSTAKQTLSPAGTYGRTSGRPLVRQESSTGSEASDFGRERMHNLSLGTLPSPSSALAAGNVQLSATTPKAPIEEQMRATTALHGGATSLPTVRETRKKGSHGDSMYEAAQHQATSSVSKHRGSETDEGSVSENTTTNPYDGDVEFAAPSTQHPLVLQTPSLAIPTSAQLISAHGSGMQFMATGQNLQRSSTSTATAPDEVPSKAYVSQTIEAQKDSDRYHSRDVKPVSAPSATEIRKSIHQAIFDADPKRTYSINPPRDGGKNPARPIRIYADGVYDLFHYAHMLQLRQAKLSFQSVYLIVGVVSSSACAAHKNEPVMTSQERYASVRNCRWVDEVVEDAPWVITQELIDRYQIDYVAHDDLPYAGAGSSASMTDIYQFAKDQGRFLPTQRTEGVSTSELLARIVEQYRNHNYDQKLAKIGHEDLTFTEPESN